MIAARHFGLSERTHDEVDNALSAHSANASLVNITTCFGTGRKNDQTVFKVDADGNTADSRRALPWVP